MQMNETPAADIQGISTGALSLDIALGGKGLPRPGRPNGCSDAGDGRDDGDPYIRLLASPVCDVPVIAMTANVLPQQVDAFLKAGMNDHIGKPFRRDKLLEAVQRYAQDEPAPTLPGKEGPGPDAFSRATFDALRTMVGPKADDWLAKFSQQLSSDFAAGPDPEERGHVARAAHVVVSTAGVLGFADLSAAARDLEQACLSGSDKSSPFARFSEARSQAIRILASLCTQPDQDRARLSA